MPLSITNFKPEPTASELISDFIAPPRFKNSSFENYIPDKSFPSQQAALATLHEFDARLQQSKHKSGLKKAWWHLNRATSTNHALGIYLDGGFGVGKTHLLTALYNANKTTSYYGSFVEYTNIIGVLGYPQALAEFSKARLIAIDEFELDDVGDTLLMTRLIRELSDQGVFIATTSNTLPGALGEGRFAAADFLREIQAMAKRFEVVRIDGEDYRRREIPKKDLSLESSEVIKLAHMSAGKAVTLDDYEMLDEHLFSLHPSKFGKLADELSAVHITNLPQINQHQDALRLVVFIDRLYERDVAIRYSGVSSNELFSKELLESGYAKKYYRCLSRFQALAAKL